MLGYLNIKNNASVVLLHEQPQYAESAAFIIAKEWKNNEGVINRNINNMKSKPISHFPCHMGLILNSAEKYKQKNNADTNEVKDDNIETVVGHAKITKADGRSDGACCIAYSVVVDMPFRGMGLGRYLMEKVEEYIKSLGISYIYLSTPDKVQFYKHLGYKESEAVSTLGGSAKHLSKTQVASLEGLFAKRLHIEPVTPNNVWLRKRLIYEYAITDPESIETMANNLSKQLSSVLPTHKSNEKMKFSSFVVRLPWQQQVGPSCGVSALTMVDSYLKQNARLFKNNSQQCNDGLDFVTDKSKICDQCSSGVLTVETTTTNMAASAIQFSIESGISHDGEMFCSYNLLFLAAKYYKMNLNVVEINENTHLKIFQSLSQGYPVVIPYDRNLSDHKPGQFNGKQAHWAIVNGVIIGKNIKEEVGVTYQHESNSMIFSIFESEAGNNIPEVELSSLNKDECYLICTHGMSSQPFICLYDDMITSNQQLVECKSKFYLTSGNLNHLRNKVVFLI